LIQGALSGLSKTCFEVVFCCQRTKSIFWSRGFWENPDTSLCRLFGLSSISQEAVVWPWTKVRLKAFGNDQYYGLEKMIASVN
jgi:hypothetical protein